MATPQIAVVMPVYNGEKYLAEAIESVRAQTFQGWELIVVDDGSQDSSVAIAQGLALQDPRIRIVQQPNARVAAARNRGASEASPSTTHLAFLDQDDFWEPDALETLYKLWNENPAWPAVHGLLRLVDERGEPIRYTSEEAFNWQRMGVANGALRRPQTDEPTTFALLTFLNHLYTPSVLLIRRDAFEKTGGLDPRAAPADDWDLYLRLALLGDFGFVPRVVASWRRHERQTSNDQKGLDDRADYVRRKLLACDMTPQQRLDAFDGYRLLFEKTFKLEQYRLRHLIQKNKRRPWRALAAMIKLGGLSLKRAGITRQSGRLRAPIEPAPVPVDRAAPSQPPQPAPPAPRTPGKGKTKVLLVVHDLSLTGAPKVIIDLFSHLSDEVELRAISLEGGGLEGRLRATCELKMIKFAAIRIHPLRLAKRLKQRLLVLRWNRWIADFNPDLIYFNSVASLPAMDYLRFPDRPTILHTHEMGWLLRVYWSRFGARVESRRPRHIIDSESAKRSFCSESGVDPERVAVVMPGIPEQDYGELQLGDLAEKRPVVVGGAGTLQWRKGPEVWLLMVHEILKKVPEKDVRFLWLGTQPGSTDTEVFLEKAALLGVKDFIDFAPVTPQPHRYFSKFDVFVVTSWEDPCPLVVMENMMLGKTVVVFEGGGGSAEQIGDAGVVVPEFSPYAMAEAVIGLLDKPDLRRKLGLRAREHVSQNLTCAVQAPKILAEIKAALGKS